jgi:SprT-like family protein
VSAARLNLALQLELSLAAWPAIPPAGAVVTTFPECATPPSSGDAILQRLCALGLRGVRHCHLTTNRRVMVSRRDDVLRVHRAFADAPPDVLQAIVMFVNGGGLARRRARRVILEYQVPSSDGPIRRARVHPDDALLVRRMAEMYAVLNARHFGNALGGADIRVSRRMKTRLGHFRPATRAFAVPEITISRWHIRRHGWTAAFDTLLHEMVHQWQLESGLPLDHGSTFRRKALDVGIHPAATWDRQKTGKTVPERGR